MMKERTVLRLTGELVDHMQPVRDVQYYCIVIVSCLVTMMLT